jgi:nicotinamidase-related amidase
VQDTPGAEFVDGLDLSGVDVVIEKGQESLVESYSPFNDPWGLFPSKLGDVLVEKGITDVFVVGLGIHPDFASLCVLG